MDVFEDSGLPSQQGTLTSTSFIGRSYPEGERIRASNNPGAFRLDSGEHETGGITYQMRNPHIETIFLIAALRGASEATLWRCHAYVIGYSIAKVKFAANNGGGYACSGPKFGQAALNFKRTTRGISV
jgi:hypothetical protein